MDLELVSEEIGRKRDLLWDALMKECGIDEARVTSSARGAYNRAVSQLRRVRASADEVRVRGQLYRVRFPHSALTPSALCRQAGVPGSRGR